MQECNFWEYILHTVHYFFSIECGDSSSADLIACPSPSARGEFFCIREEYLCDKRMDCPNGEDEDLVSCMFHQWVSLSVASHTFFISRIVFWKLIIYTSLIGSNLKPISHCSLTLDQLLEPFLVINDI